MTNGVGGCFFRIQDFVFRPDKLVHIDQEVGTGPHAGEHGLLLWFSYPLSPDRRISNIKRQGTILWFPSVDDCEEQLEKLSGVHRGSGT